MRKNNKHLFEDEDEDQDEDLKRQYINAVSNKEKLLNYDK